MKAQVKAREEMNVPIDGNDVTIEKDSTVLEAARSAGISIPALCFHPNLPSSSHPSSHVAGCY
jgi:predicted molibdopterin-dependent oxidoreductase YjgC